MPQYHEDYVSEKKMRGWSKDEREEQREMNWMIRLEFYAENRKNAQFIKMIEKWYNDYDGNVPTLTMMKYAKMAKNLQLTSRIDDPIFQSRIINKIIEERERLNEKFGWTD